MVTISANDQRPRRYGNTQFRYSLVYVCITFLVLLFLNIYTSRNSQMLFYKSKETSMIEKCQLAAAEIGKLDAINTSTISQTVKQMEGLNASRIIVTDIMGVAIYDSNFQDSALGQYVLFSEIVYAMDGTYGNDVFSWQYRQSEGVMLSHAATPIVSYGKIVGCLYLMEYDAEQGALIQRLQSNMLTTTLILEAVVILFSILFATGFSARLRRVSSSMRIIREGDYSHRVVMGGRDELTYLGDEFNLLTARLQISEDKRRQFVSDASHELKTPLASIKLLTDSILQNDMDIDTVREFVGDIGNEADRLNRMTQKLLSLSRIEGQQDGVCEIVRMKPTIDRVLRMLKGIAEKNEVCIETQLEEDCPILILEDDLYQITFNLVENGIKYNMPGGKLTIRTFRRGENAVLEVQDSGVGIPEDAIPHLFERFYRVDKARSRSTGGTGLGLAIVRNMVERNQGTIRVSSVMHQGSTFTVEFPAFDPEEVVQ